MWSNKVPYSRKRFLFPTHRASLPVRPPCVCQPCYVIHLYPESGSQSKMLCLKPVRNTRTSSHVIVVSLAYTICTLTLLRGINQNSIRGYLPWRNYRCVHPWDVWGDSKSKRNKTHNTHSRPSLTHDLACSHAPK